MKKTIILIILSFFPRLVFCQGVVSEDLDDPSPFVRSNALLQIQDLKLTEFTQDLEDRIFLQPEPFMINMYLRTLKELESTNLHDIATEFIDVADNFNNLNPPKDPLESKVMATEVLFSFNDYSTVEYVFEILNRDRPKINAIAFSLLKEIIINVPEYEQMAKSELLYIVNNIPPTTNGPIDYYRYNAIITLYEFYNSEVVENVIVLTENDPFMPTRSASLKILINNNYQGLNQLLKERLLVDPDWPLRISIADNILTKFGEPADLKAVIDYQPNEPNETARSLMTYSIDKFIPPNQAFPSLDAWILNLISYTDDLYEYEWITDEETYNYYQDKLYELRKVIENGYDEEACTIIYEDLLEKIDQDEQEGLITIEGYKFLHYHIIYIKEIFEEEIGGCQ